ncbi:cytochrome o ubiquinol oxidase operon protein cyoD [Tistlia consotensis]|uniref:Cytochrome bo(3) ubiquinol oxidase subunit 4 n=1 Tax=Tistlia consotensis USBA 355 TaxID=560819 RepID=A0A1Y6CX42_9PROT|nr:cytochrome o ubiquinol oxidase subunit IV [Tistlia consotensis]SMF84615.1 cytochrome o ubiquinol oxidase operon protein cyoD [Tistlia consotensis USBA 355]SNS37331.1 cytochrome o ubiquinol oxidase operon protein cyoD [Tistlia consotensis]
MSGGRQELTPEAARERVQELRACVWGLGLALLLTLVPFALVALGGLPRQPTLWTIGLLALVQIVVHFRFFLHIDLSRQKREDLQLILFSLLILLIMVGGTLWIIFDLYVRMMPAMLP